MIDLEQEAVKRLSSSRFAHVRGVVEASIQLAQRYDVDVDKVRQAAWLHDMFRELSQSQLEELAHLTGACVPAGPVAVWHGPICALRMAQDFGINDEDVKEAVKWHTIGHPEMGDVAQVLYVADAIEKGRSFPLVDTLRAASQICLPLAVAVVTDASLNHLLNKHDQIDLLTVQLRNKAWSLVTQDHRQWFDRQRFPTN